jgi:hypothetical protein
MLEELKTAFKRLSLESTTVFLAWLGLASGLPLLFNPHLFAPNSVDAVYPAWMISIWAAFLVLGSILTITGLLSKQWIKLRIEQAGLAALATGSFLYGTAIVSYTQSLSASWLVIATFLLFVVACIARFRNLGKVANAFEYANKLDRENQELREKVGSLEKKVDE